MKRQKELKRKQKAAEKMARRHGKRKRQQEMAGIAQEIVASDAQGEAPTIDTEPTSAV
jgi:hypothetical protein